MPYPLDPGSKTLGTSEEAAQAITGHASNVRSRVLAFFVDRYPDCYTADEVSTALAETVLTVRPRVSELRRSGLIEPAEQRRPNRSGMLAQCWRAKVKTGGGA